MRCVFFEAGIRWRLAPGKSTNELWSRGETMSLLGLDIGTSGCKVTILDSQGNVKAAQSKQYSLHSSAPGWLELDPVMVWNSVKEIIAAAIASYRGEKVEAISISSFGESVVPIDASGAVLDNSILYVDVRGKLEAAYLEKKLGNDTVLAITGCAIHSMYSINKILWLKNNRPDVFRAATKFLLFADFILFKLGAKPYTDYSLAARTMAFDVINKRWSSKILDCAGISDDKFGTPVLAGTVAGEVSPSIADELGLPRNTLLVTGGHDQTCAALGAGVIRGKVAVDGLGTVECVTSVFEQPIISQTMADNNFICIPHVVKDLYATYAFNFSGGGLLKWFRNTLALEEELVAQRTGKNIYECIIAQAAKDPTDLYLLPHFAGAGTPYMDTESRGAIVGLTIGTTRGQLIRAVLEGITYEMMVNMERLDESGVTIHELRAVGGLAHSDWFLQLKADMMGMEIISLNVPQAGTLGVAILAGVACGVYTSAEKAVEQLIKVNKRFTPDPKVHDRYMEKFARYKKMYSAIKTVLS